MPPQITGDLQTALTGAAFAPVTRAFLRITGPDATRWLNGMVTNSIQALEPGQGNYNFLLNAQGRIQGDCTIYRELTDAEGHPSFLLATDISQVGLVQELLDRFIIMDDVELTHLPISKCLLLVGPELGALFPAIGDSVAPETYAENHLYDFFGALATTSGPHAVLSLCIAAASDIQADSMVEALLSSGAVQLLPATLEALRILEARPRYGTDIRNTDTSKDLPQETNQPQALHFSKGCYLGQEIVERIRSRGQVHRLFTPLRLSGPPPETFPVPLESDGKPAGEITSAAPVSTTEGNVWLALGYVRREFLNNHAVLNFPGGTARPRTAGQLE